MTSKRGLRKARKRQIYSQEFRQEAVQMVLDGHSVTLYVAKGIKTGFASGMFFWGCCAAAPEKIAGERSIVSRRSQRRHGA